METKTIKIAGKDVVLAYCIGTEILFHGLAGIEFKKFLQEVTEKKTTDPKNIIYAILAATMAYSQYKEIDEQINDKDLMFNATNEELIAAMMEITKMFMVWYKMPVGEAQKTKKGPKGKN